MKQEYIKTQDKKILDEINLFTEQVINKDNHYYNKLRSYNLDNEQLKYCL